MDRLRQSSPHSLVGLTLTVVVWVGVIYLMLGLLLPKPNFLPGNESAGSISAAAENLRQNVLRAVPTLGRIDNALDLAERNP